MENKLKLVALVFSATMLSACGNSLQNKSDDFANIFQLQINVNSDKTTLENAYNAKAIVWHQEDGFAIFKRNVPIKINGLQTQATATVPDFVVAEANGSGVLTTSSGEVAWSSGHTTWGGGLLTWGGGWTNWQGGSTPKLPLENQNIYKQIMLDRTQEVANNFGAGVRVAVLDTGIDTKHPLFANRLSPANTWKDFVDGDSNPEESDATGMAFGHGTGVAGVILQTSPKAQIMPIRVLDSNGRGDLDKVIQGIDWAIQNGANVINMSLGSYQNIDAFYNMIMYAAKKQIFIVASAGNEKALNKLTFPGAMTYWNQLKPFIFGVSSIDREGIISKFASYGWEVFTLAPGETIFSAYPETRMAKFTGTSFSAPFLSGTLAMMLGDADKKTDKSTFHDLLYGAQYTTNVQANNIAARGISEIGNGQLDVEASLRSLPGWKPRLKADELLKSGGFENESLKNWILEYAGASITEGNAKLGEKSLKVAVGGRALKIIEGLTPNTFYTITAWMKTTIGSTGGMWLCVDASGDQSNCRRTESNSYQKRTVTFKTGAANTSVQMTLSNASTANAYVDEVSVRRY